jgi:hypothetical protein
MSMSTLDVDENAAFEPTFGRNSPLNLWEEWDCRSSPSALKLARRGPVSEEG